MKAILRQIGINLLSLYLVDLFYPGFSVSNNLEIFALAAVVWYFLNKIIRPIIKLLLLPINLITLGLFTWAASVITIVILQKFVPGISISPFDFPGINFQGFTIPPAHLNLLFSYIATSIFLDTVRSATKWLISKD